MRGLRPSRARVLTLAVTTVAVFLLAAAAFILGVATIADSEVGW